MSDKRCLLSFVKTIRIPITSALFLPVKEWSQAASRQRRTPGQAEGAPPDASLHEEFDQSIGFAALQVIQAFAELLPGHVTRDLTFSCATIPDQLLLLTLSNELAGNGNIVNITRVCQSFLRDELSYWQTASSAHS